MQVSARILGQDYGLTAEEMNRVLVKLGFLIGSPGAYSPTEKALEYVTEKDFHRGCGGYSCYNRYWTTRTYDDSIKEVLDVTPEIISEVRTEITEERAAKTALRIAEQAKANSEFLAKQAKEKARIAEAELMEARIENWKKAGKIGLAIGIGVGVGYGIYKTTPYVKKWWKNRKDNNKDKCAKTEHNLS